MHKESWAKRVALCLMRFTKSLLASVRWCSLLSLPAFRGISMWPTDNPTIGLGVPSENEYPKAVMSL